MEDTTLPADDIDSRHDTKLISEEVKKTKSAEKEDEEVVKPVTSTSSFYTLIASTLAGLVALWMVNKGIIGSEMKTVATESLTLLFSTSIIVGMAWISGKFIEARGKVSVAKLQLVTQRLAMRNQ